MRNRKTLFALLMVILVGLGVYTAGSASAALARNSVNNSGYSNTNLLVCGEAGVCVTLFPGATTYQNSSWNPSYVAVGPYQKAQHRIVKDDYVSPWTYLPRNGATGTWIQAGDQQNFFGNGAQLQVIIDDPR